jgi:DNA-directed RNA polymerase specialized sigma24 family protein
VRLTVRDADGVYQVLELRDRVLDAPDSRDGRALAIYEGGASYAEVARLLRCSKPTAWRAVQRAVRRLEPRARRFGYAIPRP